VNRRRKLQRHLPPCVYEKHGAFYFVKAGVWTRLGKTLPEALQAYAQRLDAPRGGMIDLIDKVLKEHGKAVSKNTLAQYEDCAKILRRKLAKFAPDQVKAKHVAGIRMADDMRAAPTMANRVLSFLRVVFGYAVEWQIVESNPCIGARRNPEHKRGRLLSDTEWWAIHAKADPRLKVIMELQYLTGQRITDVLTIRRSQLTAEGIEFAQQKTAARLVVAWSPELRRTVASADALSPTKAVTLLQGRTGAAPQYSLIGKQFREAAAAAGVSDARLNDTRAKAATKAKQQGHDPQALLGHTSPAMTERYLRDRQTPVVSGPSIRQILDTPKKRKGNQ
jgi:integrase